jgi:class 3 adenylate cyclase
MHTDVQLAVVFADVVGSTQLYDRLGEEIARELIASTLDLMREATVAHRGSVVKTMGDEIMSTFAEPSDAIAAAARMQRLIGTDHATSSGPARIALRIGCHFGPVLLDQADVFGSTVHTANRLTSQAKAGQIMVTEDVVARLTPEWRTTVRHVDVAKLKGFRDEVALYEVIWQPEDITSVLHVPSILGAAKKRSARLEVRVGTVSASLDDDRTVLSLGRAEGNDLIVPGSLVSRLHARLEVGRGSFQFVDQSTNGSFVHPDDGDVVFVRRDTITLVGSGRIGLGREPRDDDPGTIFYRSVD